MSIAKQLVKLQGGILTVKSKVDEGSEFSFTLPYKNSTDVLKKSKEKVEYNLEEIKKLNILLVEDNPLNVLLVKSIFAENNLKLEVAKDGRKCLDKVKENKFDIILMDIELPVMNGYEATAIIRKMMKNNIPIIAMTAHAMAGEKEKCLECEMNDYLSKPINPNHLFEKIYNLTYPQ